ncbi:MAG TPA: class I SAM-dependent methyltransferase [Pyrinomonadaceae bacterium]|nr:class I SAM-dependent methyltransferase [Pyrinomonadaceae bacterium]
MKNRDESSERSPANFEGRVPEFFDHQAATFERRAGLPEIYCREIARAVIEIGEAGAGDLVVELGPGTGQIGRWFGAGVRYVGLDLSVGMLREFRARLGDEQVERVLVRSDAQGNWPIADASAHVVFSSRAIHLLDQEHVAREMFRVAAREGAMLIIGRVRREPQSMRARMAREMNERLRARGFEGRGGERQNRKLFEACSRHGAKILEPVTVARWTVSTSPQVSLDSWRSLVSLGGINVPSKVRDEILTELEGWARKEVGALNREFESEETYLLYPLRCVATQGRT